MDDPWTWAGVGAAGGSRSVFLGSSDPLAAEYVPQCEELAGVIEGAGLTVSISKTVSERDGSPRSSHAARVAAVNDALRDESVAAIIDVTGGNRANEILDELDWEAARSRRPLVMGYSDLTSLILPLGAMAGVPAVLFQARHAVIPGNDDLRQEFVNFLVSGDTELVSPAVEPIAGDLPERGRIIGGNLRTMLKLAGTRHFPRLADSVVLIEGLRSGPDALVPQLAQLRSIMRDQVPAALLVGQFTTFEKDHGRAKLLRLIEEIFGTAVPTIASVPGVGHAADSRGLAIGATYEFGGGRARPIVR